MADNNCGQTTIIPDNNQVNLQDVNRTITVTDNNCCTTVDVTQPITQVVQVLTGPIGATGAAGVLPTSGSLNLTGSINVSGSITANNFYGDLFGTASFSLTASYVLNSGLTYAIVTGSITASVDVGNTIFLVKSGSYTPFSISNTGEVTISGSASTLLSVKNTNNTSILAVSQSGVIVLATSSVELFSSAPNGGIYFTSSSLYIGVD